MASCPRSPSAWIDKGLTRSSGSAPRREQPEGPRIRVPWISGPRSGVAICAMARLPSGIVTFCFTDVEGSTRLFRELGDEFPELLRRHHALVQDAFEAHG